MVDPTLPLPGLSPVSGKSSQTSPGAYWRRALYERNWRLIDLASLTPEERALIDHLVTRHGNSILHV